MKIELTEQEANFLRQLLDQVTVRGVDAKAAILRIMIKLGEGELKAPASLGEQDRESAGSQ